VWLAALVAPPGGTAATVLVLAVALVPAALRAFAQRLGTARLAWPPWLAAAATASLATGLGGGPGRPLAALGILVAAGAGAALPGRAAALVVAALGVTDLVTGLRLDASLSALSAHLLALGVAAAAPAILLARLRSSRDELQDKLASLTGVAASAPSGPQAGDEPPRTPRREGRSEGGGVSSELAGLLEITRRALRARSCVLYERVLDPPSWRVAAGASVAPDYDGLATAPLGHGLVAWAARHEMPFRISEPGPQLRSVPHHAGDSETGSLLAVPLASSAPVARTEDEGGAWAVLVVDSPHPRRFDEEAEDLLALHAAEISERLELGRTLARWQHDRAATRQLPEAVHRLRLGGGLVPVAEELLGEALRLSEAGAGAVLWFDARAADGGPGAAGERGRGPILLASAGIEWPAGHRLEASEESWATWAAANPDQQVALAAFHADRGMPRVARDDGLDSSWSFAAESLERAGALALAWPERHLPGAATLEALRVLAAAGGSALLREEALARLSESRRLDGLTGLPTRTAFLLRGAELAQAATEASGRLGLLLFDLDRSGRLYREAGPQAWDQAVETVAVALRAALPASAELHRWGGDEFAALLPSAGDEGVVVASRRACAAAAQAQVAGRNLTVSAGTASFRPDREDFTGLLARAGQALGVAREVGEGKVVGAQEPPA
jgi:diguanylate cyclase (GGDEF)-like protein